MRKLRIAVVSILIAAVLFYILVIPLVNNFYGKQVEKDLRSIPLPQQTELIDSVSKAGKLTGNGNGMQYFGAVMLKSKLSLEDLEKYYIPYRKDEWSCIVEPQKGQSAAMIEHGSVQFSQKAQGDGYYIVYSWGNGPEFFSEMDLRGH